VRLQDRCEYTTERGFSSLESKSRKRASTESCVIVVGGRRRGKKEGDKKNNDSCKKTGWAREEIEKDSANRALVV